MKFKIGDLVRYQFYDKYLPAPPWPGPDKEGLGFVVKIVVKEFDHDDFMLDYDFGFGYEGYKPLPYAEVWIYIPGYGTCGFWEKELDLLSPVDREEDE